jgi:amidohydrolase
MPQRGKDTAKQIVDDFRGQLIELSHRIHAHPELAFEEDRASAWVAETLAQAGFDVEMGICELPTAFAARTGHGPLQIGICAEYDALPDIGHACGHNVIAAAAAGAGLALAPMVDDLAITVTVFGTPAEEAGGGKVRMLDRGAFAGIHAAMMVHPAPVELETMPCLAVSQLVVHFHGKAAHASAFPELGINAADAATVAQVAIGLLRQHISVSDRIHGIVTRGGEAPNIVPAQVSGEWNVRARTKEDLATLEARVRRCFEAGAVATGATLDIEPKGPVYAEMRDDTELVGLYRGNAEQLGRQFRPLPGDLGQRYAGSTDMGNVSQLLPTIHPMLGLGCLPVVNHQPEFTAQCVTPTADHAVTDGATAMAWTVIDAATRPAVRDRLLGHP